MKPVQELTVGELAAFVQHHLRGHGIATVLTGGSCVAIHARGLYVSKDLDYVLTSFTRRRVVAAAMRDIGFEEQGRYFVHAETEYWIEFPAGPLSIGREAPREIVTLVFSTGQLQLLSPTDCVKDRLAAFYYWNDWPSLEQALLVIRTSDVNLLEVERWSSAEGKQAKFNEVLQRLAERGTD